MSSGPLIYFTRFNPGEVAHGGTRRLRQLKALLSAHDCTLVPAAEVPRRKLLGVGDYAKNVLRNKLGFESEDWEPRHAGLANRMRSVAAYWAEHFELPNDCRIALVDDPIYFSPLISWLKSRQKRVIGIIHNLESLSGGQARPERQRALLDAELDAISLCDAVITISEEERLLLENLGSRVLHVPYYPVGKDLAWLESIRNQRLSKKGQKQGVLLFGSAVNVPTRQGMAEALEAWQGAGLTSTLGCQLLVAGYGTSALEDTAMRTESRLLGELSDAQLGNALVEASAVLCYQARASGALTRVCEMLIAGIPVIANHIAARSYHNVPGVFEFTEFDELPELVPQAIAEIPPKPNDSNHRAIVSMEKLLNEL